MVDELIDDRERMLEIRVDDDHHFAVGRLQAGADGGFLAEVAREGEQAQRTIHGKDFRAGAIIAAIVDHDHVEVVGQA